MDPRPTLPSRGAVIGNHLPRQCGIATFTTDLCDAIHAEYGAVELLDSLFSPSQEKAYLAHPSESAIEKTLQDVDRDAQTRMNVVVHIIATVGIRNVDVI
jgi:hypothetical protein